MDSVVIETGMDVTQAAQLFREVVKKRPLVARACRTEMYTPDIGPLAGVGGIKDPTYGVAVDLTPPNVAAGGTIVLIVKSEPFGSTCMVSFEKNSALNFGAPVKSTAKRLVERLRAAPPPRR